MNPINAITIAASLGSIAISSVTAYLRAGDRLRIAQLEQELDALWARVEGAAQVPNSDSEPSHTPREDGDGLVEAVRVSKTDKVAYDKVSKPYRDPGLMEPSPIDAGDDPISPLTSDDYEWVDSWSDPTDNEGVPHEFTYEADGSRLFRHDAEVGHMYPDLLDFMATWFEGDHEAVGAELRVRGEEDHFMVRIIPDRMSSPYD